MSAEVFAPMQGRPQPAAAEVRQYPQLHISHHPLILRKLTLLRRAETNEKHFDELVAELTWLLGYEAMADLPLRPAPVQTPLEMTEGCELSQRIAVVPILRAGLSMVAGFRQLIPEARVWHLGMYRDERTGNAVEYYNRLPKQTTKHLCFILDPMLATGGSAVKAVELLKTSGAGCVKFVGLIASPYGVKVLADRFPDVAIHVAALDRELNSRGYILPGLGDAGDRQFDRG
jgi:uracil phosphoribosyltransferase